MDFNRKYIIENIKMRKRTGAIHCDNEEEYIRVFFFINFKVGRNIIRKFILFRIRETDEKKILIRRIKI